MDNHDDIEEDTIYVQEEIDIKSEENTADAEIIQTQDQQEILNKKIESIIKTFNIGETEDFKNMMIGIVNLIRDNRIRIFELEEELNKIKEEFYRNELTDKDFRDLLMLDEEE